MAEVKRSSIYRRTPNRDFYLDVWVPVFIEPQDSDVEVTISADHHLRPDLLAYEIYGTPNLYWVFAIRNKNVLIDPINDFTAGTVIFVPAPDTIERLMN